MPREITAYSNPLVKRVRDLRDKRHRREARQFLAEGLRILTEARETDRLPALLFYAAPSRMHPLVQSLVREAKGGVQAPKQVIQVDGIPLTGLGKPDKKALRARFWEGRRSVG